MTPIPNLGTRSIMCCLSTQAVSMAKALRWSAFSLGTSNGHISAVTSPHLVLVCRCIQSDCLGLMGP